MEPTKPFRSLADVDRHRSMLRLQREGHAASVRRHWNTLSEPGFRSGVLNGALRSLWKAWNPVDTLRSLFMQPTDLAGTMLGFALGNKARTGWGRLLVWLTGAMMPRAMEHVRSNDGMRHLLSEIERSWERVKAYVRQRQEARRERSS